MTHSHVCHDSCTHVSTRHSTHVCYAWLIYMFSMTHDMCVLPHGTHVMSHDSLICCAMTHSHVYHGSFTRVPWLILVCSMAHSHVCHDHSHVCHDSPIREPGLTLMCDMTHSCVSTASFICVILCNALQHTATHSNALQHTAAHCSALQRTATHCNALQRNALQRTTTHWNALKRTATRYSTLYGTVAMLPHQNFGPDEDKSAGSFNEKAAHCNTLSLAATVCSAMGWLRLVGCLKL